MPPIAARVKSAGVIRSPISPAPRNRTAHRDHALAAITPRDTRVSIVEAPCRAARAARHGASTMDTLVSLGVTAASAWSLWAVVFGGAGEIGLRMTPALFPRAAMGGMEVPELYFEVAAVVTTFLLAGRYAEHRSRRRAGDALRTLLSMGATDVALLTTDDAGRRTERRVPVASLQVGDVFAVRPGEKVATDGVAVS